MKKKSIIIILLLVFGIVAAGMFYLGKNQHKDSAPPVKTAQNDQTKKEKKILFWRAPMNPNEIYKQPGKSQMGMDLVPVYEDEASSAGTVTISGAMQQNMNVKTAVVENRELSPKVITNGILVQNEKTEYIATTRVNGWVEKLYVNYTGQVVKKGEKLMDIYSPELVAAQQELLTALSYQESVKSSGFPEAVASGDELFKSAVRKLELLEIPASEIERLKTTGEVKTYITLYAQNSGTVIEKTVVEGQKIMAGTTLLRIADLSRLWLIADVYEYELSKIQLGLSVEITFNYLPGKTYHGKISFIYPTIDNKTRTARVRIDIHNHNGELKPSMFANVIIKGKSLGTYPVLPEQAVLRSGQKSIVILVLDEGKFKPVEIKLGVYSDGYYQVLEGLTKSDTIVTSAQFLIDSESNLRAALSQFGSSTKKDEPGKMESMEDSDNKAKRQNKDPRIREGIIDLEAIDKNKDDKLYEDVMDWNVISDEPGTCPLCGMTLKEFSIKDVKKNLMEHGLKHKE